MQKCAYCAEWIPNDVERCPNCEQPILSEPLEKTAPFVEGGVSDLIRDFREQVDGTEAPNTFPGVDEHLQEDLPAYDQDGDVSFLQDESATGGLSVFKSRDVTDFSDAQGDVGFVPSRYEALDDKTVKRQISPALLRRAIVLGGSFIGAVACLAVILIFARPFLGSILAAAPDATDTPAPTATPTKRSIPTSNVPTQNAVSETPTPVNETIEGCISWDQVGEDDVGKELCVYGEVRRWFASGDIPFVAIFSEDLGTFAFIDRSTSYEQVGPGTCVTATGTVKLMRNIRPHIEVEGDLELCD